VVSVDEFKRRDLSAPEDWYFDTWAKTRDDGLVPYVIVTANRLQMSKTGSVMRLQEKIMEEVEGRKFDNDDMTFNALGFTDRWEKVSEWTPLSLDEPNRPGGAGNRNWQSPENNALVEWLQTRAFEHRPSFFSLPHSRLLDLNIDSVCTSEIVMDRRGHGLVYEFQRNMLNRTGKTKTRYLGELFIGQPYAWDWAEYMKRRTEYTRQRGDRIRETLAAIQKSSDAPIVALSQEDVLSVIMSEPKEYQQRGTYSPSLVASKLKIPYSKAQRACMDAKLMEKENLSAESKT